MAKKLTGSQRVSRAGAVESNIIYLTRSQYNALQTKDPTKLYVITKS